VGGRVRLYVDCLDSLWLYISRGVVKNWGGPYKEGSILWAYRQLREHAGCNSFPTQIHGNADAHLLILLHIATRLCITTVISDWLPVERQVIEHRYAAIMTLDN
jgi:hypothetical protein